MYRAKPIRLAGPAAARSARHAVALRRLQGLGALRRRAGAVRLNGLGLMTCTVDASGARVCNESNIPPVKYLGPFCPQIDCAAPRFGCTYQGPAPLNAAGCRTGCGRLVCGPGGGLDTNPPLSCGSGFVLSPDGASCVAAAPATNPCTGITAPSGYKTVIVNGVCVFEDANKCTYDVNTGLLIACPPNTKPTSGSNSMFPPAAATTPAATGTSFFSSGIFANIPTWAWYAAGGLAVGALFFNSKR